MREGSRECLVTGGSGFLGRHVVSSLEARGCAVTVLSRTGLPGKPSVLVDLGSGAVDLGRARYDTVYHAAGLAHLVPRTPAEARQFTIVNVDGTRALLRALDRTALPEAFLLVSTVAVYGAEQGSGLDESTPREARDPYGQSRIRAEDLVLEWGARSGVRTAVVRLPLVAGRGAPGNLGRMVAGLAAGRYVGIGDGSARRSVVRAADVAEALPAIAAAGGVYHLTDGEHPSFAELEAALAAALGRAACPRLPLAAARALALLGDALEAVSRRPAPFNGRTLAKMTSTLTFSDQRARETVGWAPRRVLERAGELVAEHTGDPSMS